MLKPMTCGELSGFSSMGSDMVLVAIPVDEPVEIALVRHCPAGQYLIKRLEFRKTSISASEIVQPLSVAGIAPCSIGVMVSIGNCWIGCA